VIYCGFILKRHYRAHTIFIGHLQSVPRIFSMDEKSSERKRQKNEYNKEITHGF